MSVRRVIIVGGGIGGLTTANALMQKGLQVKLYDKAPFFSPTVGAGFSLSPNGQIVLDRLGFTPQLEKILHPQKNWHLLSARTGKMLYEGDFLAQIHKEFGYSLGGCTRADLVDVLAAPLSKEKSIFYNKCVVDVKQNDTEAIVHFADGSTDTADIVIGADGILSPVGTAIFGGEHDTPVFSSENIFYGVVEGNHNFKHPAIGHKHTLVQMFDESEFISYYTGGPQGNLMLWAATYRSKSPPQSGSSSNTKDWTVAASPKDQLGEFLKTKPAYHPAHELAAISRPEQLLHFGLFFRAHKKRWHVGRVCLLGDSCHATLPYVGQGANMAVEDAIVLAQELEKHNFQHKPAFDGYYARRHARTERVVNFAHKLGKFCHVQGKFKMGLRDFALKWSMKSGLFFKAAKAEIMNDCPIPLKSAHGKAH